MRQGGMRSRWVGCLFGSLLLGSVSQSEAQVLPGADAPNLLAASHTARLAANPPGLSIVIRTREGRQRFAQGERIRLDLEFLDTSGRDYPFHSIGYDRSGRLGIDRVVVEPGAGAEDPLHDYYRALGFGVIGGGLSTPPSPLEGPRTITVDLNEQVRFVRPGTYVVFVESRRFQAPADTHPGLRGPVVVVSNALALEIVPVPGDTPVAATMSARDLRFADSPSAASEMARRLLRLDGPTNRVGADGHELRFGLLGTAHREAALIALREGLAASTRAVDEAVPEVAAFLDVMIAMPRRSVAVGAETDEPAERVRARMALYRCRLAFWRHQALGAGLRGGPADVARSSVAFSQEVPPDCPPMASVDLARVLPPVFDDLPAAQQRLMLTYRWGDVAGPAMLRVLLGLLDPASSTDDQTRDAALVRLAELSASDAVRVSHDDVVSGRLRFSARSLRVPLEHVPAARRTLAAHLRRAREAATPLSDLQEGQGANARGLLPALVRFGTREDLEVLIGWPHAEQAPCAPRASVLALSLSVDRERGERLLRSALSDRGSRCGEMVLEDLARSWPLRLRERVVIDALWHEHLPVAASAARTLALLGTDAAHEALWRRLDQWHGEWVGREADLLRQPSRTDDPVAQATALERALREALLRGRGWLATADDRLRVQASCVTAACREDFSPFRQGPPVRQVVIQAEEWTGATVFRAGVHSFEALADLLDTLTQYPATTTFTWQAGSSHAPARATYLYETLSAAAARRGIGISGPSAAVP